MTTLLIGANGQLGSELRQALSDHELVPLRHSDMELTDPAQVRGALARHRPDLILNTAAYHRVDACEDEPERAFAVNALAVRDLALAAEALSATLVHFSTDYVFDGRQRRPYREVDRPAPLNVYGASKLAGECFVQAIVTRHFVVRTCGLYGFAGKSEGSGNFVETMLRLAGGGRDIQVVTDQVVTPTSAKDLAWKVGELVRTDAYGLYHITNRGACSWFQFARTIFELSGVEATLRETTSAAFGAKARRPLYSVLDHDRLRQVGLAEMRIWQEALADYLEERKRRSRP